MHDEWCEHHVVTRGPSPGIAAVLSVLLPGLGHLYCGRLLAGLGWFAAVSFGYWAILVPGFLLHVAAVFFAYSSARRFDGQRIGYPRIGAGLAGGDWSEIAGIIGEELEGQDHTLVEFDG